METNAGTQALTVKPVGPTPEQNAALSRVVPSGTAQYFTQYDAVIAFHAAALQKGTCLIGNITQNTPVEVLEGSKKLIDEEVNTELMAVLNKMIELGGAASLEQKAEFLDHIVDSVYILMGTAVAMGLPYDLAFEAVHRANMRKVICADGPQFNEFGKIIKPEGWVGPNQEIWNICQQMYAMMMKTNPNTQNNLPPEISDGSTGAPESITLAVNSAIPDASPEKARD